VATGCTTVAEKSEDAVAARIFPSLSTNAAVILPISAEQLPYTGDTLNEIAV
jgi:hypothetical protein